MNKQEILDDYKNQDDKLLIAKFLDKLEFTNSKNKIKTTDFLNSIEQEKIQKIVKRLLFKRIYFLGGFEDAERKIAVLYPEKLSEEISRKNDKNLISAIRIILSNELSGQYDHRRYLGSIIKLGISREKIGDIIVNDLGADIIVKSEMADYIAQNLSYLTRFKSAKISVINIDEIKIIPVNKKEISMIVSSLRLDNIISSLIGTSRSKAKELIENEQVYVNYNMESKISKIVSQGDLIVVRKKGKFQFTEISGKTKNDKFIINIEKYIWVIIFFVLNKYIYIKKFTKALTWLQI